MDNVAPEHFYRQKPYYDTEELALTFVEEELGRFDWQNNWKAAKDRGNIRERIQKWLSALRLDKDPNEIIVYLDRLVAERPGRWR